VDQLVAWTNRLPKTWLASTDGLLGDVAASSRRADTSDGVILDDAADIGCLALPNQEPIESKASSIDLLCDGVHVGRHVL
jgi:hypothetical protein